MNKNILFVGHYPLKVGGAEEQTKITFSSLKKRGFNIFCLSPGTKKFFEKKMINGIKVYQIDRFQKDRTKYDVTQAIRYSTLEVFHPIFFIFTLYLILRYKIKHVCILTFHQISLAPLLAAKLLFRKVCINLHGFELLCSNSTILPNCDVIRGKRCAECVARKNKLKSILMKNKILKIVQISVSKYIMKTILFLKFLLVNNLANQIIFPSDYAKDMHLKFGIKKNKTKVINNFIINFDYNNKHLNFLKKKLKIKKNEKIILFVGRLEVEKGPQILLKAFNSIIKKQNNIKLIYIGEGKLLNKLETQVKKLNLDKKVIFLGRLPRENLPNYYKLSSVVVIPSIVPETFSLVFLEASLTKKIVVASKIGNLTYLIKDGENGFLFNAGDTKNLEKILEYILNNLNKLSFIAENAYRQTKVEYNIRDNVAKYENLFR